MINDKIISNYSSDVAMLFDIMELGIDRNYFRSAMNPFFNDLAYDMYEYKYRQVTFLQKCYEKEGKTIAFLRDFLKDYFIDKYDPEPFYELIENLSSDDYFSLARIKAQRKRAIAYFSLTRNEDGINIEQDEHRDFYQPDCDSYPEYRKFSPLVSEASTHPIVISLLNYFGKKIFEIHPDRLSIKVNCHFVQIESIENAPISNSPEGIHQDGMDYIVSALVVDRVNIIGGESVLYYPNENTEVYRTILEPAQGIFQVDDHTDLWHDVTSISSKDYISSGYRNSIGFDFKLG